MVELVDIFLDNGQSILVVCSHEAMSQKLEAAMKERTVTVINLTSFFKSEANESSDQELKQRLALIEELQNLPSLCVADQGRDGKLKRNPNHLVVGYLHYEEV